MKKIFLAAILLCTGSFAFAQSNAKLTEPYIAIKDALVNGDSKAAAEASVKFEQAIAENAPEAGKAELLKSAGELAKATTLEKQRAAFNDVSTRFWKIAKSMDKTTTPLYYQYCPMKKAYWVSKEKDIKNPYYGASMLTCGKVVETN